jgi:cyanoexosortase A
LLPLLLVAAVHAALAFRTGALSYEGPVAIGWTGALLVCSDRLLISRPSLVGRACGLALAAAAMALAIYWSADYRAVLRFTPLALGAGFLLAQHGFSFLRRSGQELLLLALPIVTPPPIALRPFFEPQSATLRFTAALLGLLGHRATITGDVLSIQGGAIRVLSACSGVNCMSQLAALALLLVCLFETTRAQKICVFAIAVGVGFVANCSRLALLTLLSQRSFHDFELWHSTVGELRFTCAALAFTALCWWLLLRRRSPTPLPA